jgi:DNA polymerase I-like protein with 3'-5' exonuclease and polymerase domains
MGRIERIIEPMLPRMVEAAEVKKDGQVNWVRKPFVMSGGYAAITTRSFPELEGKTAATGFVAGPFSRVRFRKMDINSRNEMVQYLLNSGWIPREWNYQTDDNGRVIKDLKGNPIPTSPKLNYKDPFDGVQGVEGQLLAKWVQCRHRQSLITGLLELVRPDGRISQRITGIADTGRLTHAGIVNIPGSRSFFGHRVRSLFVARPGFKLVGTDSVSCQDRALANRANNESFTQMLLNGDKSKGTDGHSLNQQAINAVLQPHGVQITRDDAKNHGYGWKFGASDKKLGSMVGLGMDVGAKIRDALASVSQAQAALVDKLTKEWESTAKVRMSDYGRPQLYGGTITGLDGRPIRIELPHTILVYILQSDEAIIMQYALDLLYQRLTSMGWRHGIEYGFVGNIHDEFQTEVREDLVDVYAKLSAQCIEQASRELGCAVLQQGDYSIGINWAETH